MKKIHHILIPTVTLIIISIFSACAKKDNSDESRRSRGQQSVLSHEDNIEDTASTPTPDTTHFLVRLEGNTLTLYESTSENYSVIKSLNIDTSYYPHEDIQELNAGIVAYSKEGGFEILENFSN